MRVEEAIFLAATSEEGLLVDPQSKHLACNLRGGALDRPAIQALSLHNLRGGALDRPAIQALELLVPASQALELLVHTSSSSAWLAGRLGLHNFRGGALDRPASQALGLRGLLAEAQAKHFCS
jgi:hypothetical protein